MLTYYYHLLSGLFAVTCAASVFAGPLAANRHPTPTDLLEAESSETIDVSYRGSGRLDDVPKEETSNQKKLIAHRGSGRVEPDSP